MTTIKLTAILFTFFAAAVMHDGPAGAEPSKEIEGPMADAEHTPEAAALSSCPGILRNQIAMKSGSTTLGFLNVYFDSSTGDNCAMTVAAGPASGHATFIDVCLARCTQTSPGSGCTADAEQCDAGDFHFFAGPVFVHAPGHCISAAGILTFNGSTVSADLPAADCL